MSEIERWYVGSFVSASGLRRFVGEGATMPFNEDDARRFPDKASAQSALKRIGAHHRKPGGRDTIATRKGIISKPVAATMLGL